LSRIPGASSSGAISGADRQPTSDPSPGTFARSAWRGGAATRQVPPRGKDGLAGPAVAVFAEAEK